MAHTPAGTLVMTTRNRAARAADAVERALGLPEQWPIVVVDDASDDATGDRLRNRFGPAITVIRLPRNLGAAARNVGVQKATTPFVAFVDDDSSWESGSLTRAVEVFERHPTLGLVAAQVLVDPDGRPDPICDAMGASPLAPTAAGPSVLGFLACAAVVRRQAFLAVGGFSPLMHVGGEEALLAIDLRAAHWTLTYRNDIRARHAPLMTDGGRSDRRSRQMKNAVLVALMRRSVGVAGRELAVLVRRALGDSDAARALIGVVQRLPEAVSQRRPVSPSLER
jgi:GT2 family glycosyltransferase